MMPNARDQRPSGEQRAPLVRCSARLGSPRTRSPPAKYGASAGVVRHASAPDGSVCKPEFGSLIGQAASHV
jgi:hypothetical protein